LIRTKILYVYTKIIKLCKYAAVGLRHEGHQQCRTLVVRILDKSEFARHNLALSDLLL